MEGVAGAGAAELGLGETGDECRAWDKQNTPLPCLACRGNTQQQQQQQHHHQLHR